MTFISGGEILLRVYDSFMAPVGLLALREGALFIPWEDVLFTQQRLSTIYLTQDTLHTCDHSFCGTAPRDRCLVAKPCLSLMKNPCHNPLHIFALAPT